MEFRERLGRVLNEQLGEPETEAATSKGLEQDVKKGIRRELGGATGEEETSYLTRADLAEVLKGFVSQDQLGELIETLEEQVLGPLKEMQDIFKKL
jgi:hypothetical protein